MPLYCLAGEALPQFSVPSGAGDAKTGITLMKMDTGLDAGPIIQTREIPIQDAEHSQSLHDQLSTLGGKMVLEFLENLGTEKIRTTPQPGTESPMPGN